VLKKISYWRLSSFYGFYFAALGAFIPYWGLYLEGAGFNPIEIGQLMAVILATKIIAPYLWGWIADHHNNRLFIIRLGSALTCLGFVGVFFAHTFWWLLLVLVFFSFFLNAILPQFEVLTLNYLAKNEHQYSWIRIWGSIGFVVSVSLMGIILASTSMNSVPIVVFILLLGIMLSTFICRDHQRLKSNQQSSTIVTILKNKAVIALLLVCLLVQISHGAYYTFYSIYADEQGYSKLWIGILWAIGVLSEVIAFILMPWLVKHFGLKTLLLASLFSGVLRWFLIGIYIDNLFITIIAQIFHASTFGLYHAVTIAYIHRYFKGQHQGKGQALYSSVSFGVGGALGSLSGGYLWASAGAEITFLIAAVVAFFAFVVSWKYMD
jgi:PPP family 3-phenylpropionic acid transporter